MFLNDKLYQSQEIYLIFDRAGVAGAVLHTALSLMD